MATIDVKDASGATVAIEKPLAPGRAAAALSRPVALCTEDAAFLDGLETLITTTNSLLTTLGGYVDGLEALATALNGYVDGLETLAAGAASCARLASSAASTNATNAKTAAGRVYGWQVTNKAAYDVFLVLYDSAANPPVPGTTTIRKKVCIPAGASYAQDFPNGLVFGTGIGFAFTKLGADSDTTAIASGDIVAFNLDYT